MQHRKATAWKKNRKFGDIMGGRMHAKLDSGIFKRLHSLSPPVPGVALPIFIQDNPSGAFYHPLSVEEINAILETLPEEHTRHLTHVWLSKIKKEPYLSGDIPRGFFIGGSKVCLIKLHAVSKDNRLYFGRKRPTTRNLSFYQEHSTDLRKDSNGFYLQFTDVTIRTIHRKVLLHEIGHCVDYIFNRKWSPANTKETEDFADDYARTWEDKQ